MKIKIKVKKIVLTFLLMCEAMALEGFLVERGTKTPLKGTNVFLLPLKAKAVTGDDGSFSFGPVVTSENTCKIIVNLTGYKKLEEEIDCKTAEVKLYLEKIRYSDFVTTITSKAPKRDAQMKSLKQEDFINMPGSFGGDPVRAAQNLPGVAQSGPGAQVVVQGAAPDDTGYLINGHLVPIIFHFGGLASVVAPQAVDRVELRPSGYGPEYSRAIGGIINLETKAPRNDKITNTVYVDILNAGAVSEGPIDDKRSFLISGRYSYIGQVLKLATEEEEDINIDSAPVYGDITALYRKELSNTWTYDNTFVYSRDEIEFFVQRAFGDDPALRGGLANTTEFFRFIPRLTGKLGPKTTTTHSLAIGQDKIFFNVGAQFFDLDRDVITHRSELVHEFDKKHKLFVGLDNEIDKARVSLSLPSRFNQGGVDNPFSSGEERRFNIEGTDINIGPYWRYNYQATDKLTVSPNMRFDYFSDTKEFIAQPRTQVIYQWSPKLKLNLSAGLYAQPPEPQEVSAEYGNPNITSPRSTHYTLGWEKDFLKEGQGRLSVVNNFFYKDLDDLVIPDSNSIYLNSGTGKIFGMEVQANYSKGPWSGQLVYTYLDSRRTIPGQGEFPAQFDQTHNFNLIGAYDLDRWSFSGRFRYVTGNPYTPVSQGVFDSNNDVYIPIRGRFFSERVSSFQQLDLRVERKTVYDTWILSWYVDIQNVLNRSNGEGLDYAFDYSTSVEDDGLPILPTFGVKGVF